RRAGSPRLAQGGSAQSRRRTGGTQKVPQPQNAKRPTRTGEGQEIRGQSMKQKFILLAVWSLCSWCLGGESSSSEEQCTSGLKAGQRLGPYAALISTGPQRGQSFCYVCETGDKPAIVVFAHALTDRFGTLIVELD